MIPNKVYDIIINLLPMIILFSVVMVFIRLTLLIVAKQKIIIYKEIKNLLYIIYCFALFKLITTTDFESFSNNFIPFKEMTRYNFSSVLFFRNVIGNIILFIPFGYLITDMIYEKANKINILITAFLTFITSLTTEIIQMNIGRSFDIDDIILNFIGGVIGYIIFKLIHFIFDKLPKNWPANIIKCIIFILTIFSLIFIFYKYYEVIR